MLTIEGNIVNINGQARRRVEIGNDGTILLVGEPSGKADMVFKDELIFPGFIDLHVHARECQDHSWDYKEDFTTAGQAAINGGVAAFADMPNNPVPPVDGKSYNEKYQLAKKSAVDVLLYAGIGPGTVPLKQQVPYKVFMGPSIGQLFFTGNEQLEEQIKLYKGQNVSFHCEDPVVLDKNKNHSSHNLRRPPDAEIAAINFALELIGKYQLQGKICHCSTAQGGRIIAAAKKAPNINVTAEVTPHHLYFDETMMTKDNRIMFQVNPPIRQTRDNRLALIAALKKGDIDFLASDHAPHTVPEKQNGTSGMPHLDTYGPFAAWLMAEHNFTPQEIVRVCSYNPAQFFNQFTSLKFGQIAAGFVGSLTVVDMHRPIKIEKSMLKTKCAWSPFEGVTFPGSVVMTVIKGITCLQR